MSSDGPPKRDEKARKLSPREFARRSHEVSPRAMSRFLDADRGVTEEAKRHRRLWLDDVRTPPDDSWTWVKTIEEAIIFFRAGEVEEASLDNDLGEGIPEGRKLVLWMAENDIWPTKAIRVHSANPVSAEYMEGVIERYGPFERVGRSQRFSLR